MSLTPTIAVFEEYNDNILLDNRDRRSDWITGVAPGLSFAVEGETYALTTSYSFTAEAYARETSLNEVFARQNFSLDGSYRADPRLTFTLTDAFVASVNTTPVSASTVATGRSRAWSNTVAPGAVWQLTPVTTLRLTVRHIAERFERRDLEDSDSSQLGGALERRLTRRLAGTAGYHFGYLAVERERPVATHTPRLGAVYRFTETLTGSASGGPTFEVREDGRNRVTPAATADLRQRFEFGSGSVEYERTVGVAGGLGGTTDTETVGGSLQVTDAGRDLAFELDPRYTKVHSDDGRIDVHTVTLALRLRYRVTSWLSVFAGYAFFQQRSGGTLTSRSGLPLASDVDQNRVSFGLQVGYPLRFD